MPESNASIQPLKTPMPLQVGDIDTYLLVSLQYLYEKCKREGPPWPFFMGLVKAANAVDKSTGRKSANLGMGSLGKYLAKSHFVLPRKCFLAMYDLLTSDIMQALAEQLLKDGILWTERKNVVLTKDQLAIWKKLWLKWTNSRSDEDIPRCPWPDCPDEPV